MTIRSRYSICGSATPAKSIATSSSRMPITRPSSVPNRRAVFSALTSAITSDTNAWPGSTPPDFLPQPLFGYPFVVETFQIPPLILNDLCLVNPANCERQVNPLPHGEALGPIRRTEARLSGLTVLADQHRVSPCGAYFARSFPEAYT